MVDTTNGSPTSIPKMVKIAVSPTIGAAAPRLKWRGTAGRTTAGRAQHALTVGNVSERHEVTPVEGHK